MATQAAFRTACPHRSRRWSLPFLLSLVAVACSSMALALWWNIGSPGPSRDCASAGGALLICGLTQWAIARRLQLPPPRKATFGRTESPRMLGPLFGLAAPGPGGDLCGGVGVGPIRLCSISSTLRAGCLVHGRTCAVGIAGRTIICRIPGVRIALWTEEGLAIVAAGLLGGEALLRAVDLCRGDGWAVPARAGRLEAHAGQ